MCKGNVERDFSAAKSRWKQQLVEALLNLPMLPHTITRLSLDM